MLPNALGRGLGSGSRRPVRWRNAEDDLDIIAVDLNPANDGVDDLAHALPVEAVEPLTDFGGKVFQPAKDQRQLAFGLGGFDRHLLLLLQLRHAQL